MQAVKCFCDDVCAEFYERAAEDMSSGFGGLHGRGAKRQDPAIERELVLTLEEIFHGCTKKMKISRRVWLSKLAGYDSLRFIKLFSCQVTETG